jgi:sec-independent protein translocase protein TatC
VFIVIGTGLFALGMAFAYFVILPRAIDFLTNFDDDLYDVQIRASYYLSFTALVLLASGIAFEMPMFILALVRIRVLSAAKLRRNRRIGYPLMLAFAVLLPTVDPVSLAFEVIPLLILFEISIWLSVVMEKRWNRNLPGEEEADSAPVDDDVPDDTGIAPDGDDLEWNPADDVNDVPGDDEVGFDVEDVEISDEPPTSEDETP